jgi:ATP-dependent DNA ligase
MTWGAFDRRGRSADVHGKISPQIGRANCRSNRSSEAVKERRPADPEHLALDAGQYRTATIARPDGAMIFRQACRTGLQGIVSKRLSAPYRSGPCKDWLEVKNSGSPSMMRVVAAIDAGAFETSRRP